MPMVLRARKPNASNSQELNAEGWDAAPQKQNRPRRQTAATYVEKEESVCDSDAGEEEMERHETFLPEEKAQELKECSVVLDRMGFCDKVSKSELDGKEESNTRVGKPVSRIPTFTKRFPGSTQATEIGLSRKGLVSDAAEPSEAASQAVDVVADVGEKQLPASSVCDTPLFSSSKDQYAKVTSSQSELKKLPLMTASPRPSLRQDPGLEASSLAQNKRRDLQLMDQTCAYNNPSNIKLINIDTETKISTTGSLLSEAADAPHTPKPFPVEYIMEEEPPWNAEIANTLELQDSRSASDADCDSDLEDKATVNLNEEEVKDLSELHIDSQRLSEPIEEEEQITNPISALEKSFKTKSTMSAQRSRCSSFGQFFLLPTALLLLGGLGHHVWYYGLPMSVVQLCSQMELHCLEGFGLVQQPCSDNCRAHLVESIPEGLYPSSLSPWQSIGNTWLHLLDQANHSVDVAAFYLTLRDLQFSNPTDVQGRRVFEQLKQLKSKGVKLQIALNSPQTSSQDSRELADAGAVIREVNLNALTGGIVHTKLWVVDQKHLYIGSANMDWRSLSQVKEVGLALEDCSCLAQDAGRIFSLYYSLGVANASLPPYWPARFSALSSSQNPLPLKLNGVSAQVYLSTAPPQISARGRSDDLNTILNVISDAQNFVYISVMDYLPLSEFTKPIRFWPAIDCALRAAACTAHVKVRLMVSCWQHSQASIFTFLQSLQVLQKPPLSCDIQVKVFTVPSTEEQKKIPFARVNHAKFMVTDRVLYVGTSNWSENYFTQTAGVGLVVNQTGSTVRSDQTTLQNQAEELFLRDWTSQYAEPLSVEDMHVCPLVKH
ncbi:5'-3' exonuclease PLD3 isoform 1-T1 [Synchiropus picturatus]